MSTATVIAVLREKGLEVKGFRSVPPIHFPKNHNFNEPGILLGLGENCLFFTLPENVMAKHKSLETTRKRRIKEGRGQGILGNYKPWLYVRDVPSKGLSTRIKGIKTGRVHNLLSLLELYLFYLLDWSTQVIDIQEQYPLFLKETLSISKKLNIKHPAVRVASKNNPKPDFVPVTMTTDFRVTVRKKPFGKRIVAINVKYSKDLNNPRTIKKFEIERVYWKRRNVEWKVFTERDVNKTIIKNIEWVHSFHNPDWLLQGISTTLLQEAAGHLFGLLYGDGIFLRNAGTLSDRKFNFAPGVSLLIVRHLIASRKWLVDMTIPIAPNKPLIFISQPLSLPAGKEEL